MPFMVNEYMIESVIALERQADMLFSQADDLRKEASELENKAEDLLDQIYKIKEDFKRTQYNLMRSIAQNILVASEQKLGGFALQTIDDVLDGKPLDQDQMNRLRILAREYLHFVF